METDDFSDVFQSEFTDGVASTVSVLRNVCGVAVESMGKALRRFGVDCSAVAIEKIGAVRIFSSPAVLAIGKALSPTGELGLQSAALKLK